MKEREREKKSCGIKVGNPLFLQGFKPEEPVLSLYQWILFYWVISTNLLCSLYSLFRINAKGLNQG